MADEEAHPTGEREFEQKVLVKAVATVLPEQERAAEELRLATPGGRFHVRWDDGGSATALGQLAFFAEFLEVSGLFAPVRLGPVSRRPTEKRLGYLDFLQQIPCVSVTHNPVVLGSSPGGSTILNKL